jgi:PAS domain S-box-containing protein
MPSKALRRKQHDNLVEVRMRIDESLRVVLDELNESVYFVDPDGTVIFTNIMFARRLGKTRSEVEGHSIYKIVPSDVVEQRREHVERVAFTGMPVSYEEERFGEVFLNSVSPIIDGDGHVESIAFVGTNITEQRRLLESLTGVIEKSEAFAQAITHDIRGPLSAALAAAETLQIKDSSSSPQDREMILDEIVTVLIGSLNNAFSLVDNLLMLAEIGNRTAVVEETEVSQVISEVLKERQSRIMENGTRIETPENLGTIRANRTHIYQLFSNLIGNSLEYNSVPKPVCSIEYLGQKATGIHSYRVRDNGPGLQDDLIDNIFDPFVRGEDGKSGLGLAIVHRIVNTYHGYILAYNDNGAVFEFALKDV